MRVSKMVSLDNLFIIVCICTLLGKYLEINRFGFIHLFFVVKILVGFHAVLALILFQAIFTNKCLATSTVFVHVMSLEVGEMFDHFSTLKTLVTLRQVAHWQRALK